MNYKILIVDDEPANLRLLERLFRREYQIVAAESGAEALELLTMHDVALIISDQRMPGMTGIEFLKRAAEMRQHTVRIVLTGYTDVNSLVEAINSGVVYKYVSKPWVNEDLQQTVVRAIEHYETIKNQYQLKLQNERLSEQLKLAQQGFVRLIAAALDSKDAFLHSHLRRASNYAVAIGHQLNLDAPQLERLSLAAFLYKVGQIFIPARILDITAPPTDEERQSVKRDAQRAAQLIANFPGLEDIALAVRYHDEHFDGGESAVNLFGEQIPLFARIIAVADAYDKMTAPSNSVETVTHDEAVEKLQSDAGKRFDPNIIKAFSELESIGRIRQAINEGVIGKRLLRSYSPCEADAWSTGELLQKFKTEPMLALYALQLANMTSGAEPTAQLITAMSELGEDKLRSIVMQYGLPPEDDTIKASSLRAVRRAVAAQLLSAHTDLIDPDEAYTLGLLYDVGETLLLNLFPHEMLSLEGFDEKTRFRRQIEIFGIDAAQISRQMLEVSGIPTVLTAAVESWQDLMSVGNSPALLLQAADVIAFASESDNKITAMNSVGSNLLEILNLSRADLNEICDRASFISEGHIEAPEQSRETVN